MGESLHVCYEGGVINLGYSRLAADVLSKSHALPGRWERELIAQDLLQEAADDGVLKELWVHAGQIALMQDYPEIPVDPAQNDR